MIPLPAPLDVWIREHELGGHCTVELQAILNLWRGLDQYECGHYVEALAHYEQAEQGLPPKGEKLRRQLGQAMNDLAGKLLWPERPSGVDDAKIKDILQRVVKWLP